LEDHRVLQKSKRVLKRELNSIFGQLEVLVCSLIRFRVQEIELADKYRCEKGLWNTDQPKIQKRGVSEELVPL